MARRLFFWELGGFLLTAAAGALLRRAYEWNGGGAFLAAFSAVNGSVWEGMKTFFFPLFAVSVAQTGVLGRNYPDFPAVRAVSVLTGLALVPALYYTYAGAVGEGGARTAGAAILLADAAAFALDYRLLRRGRLHRPWQQVAGLAVLWGLAFAFVWCTFRPPGLPLWRPPASGGPGVPAWTAQDLGCGSRPAPAGTRWGP